MKRGNMTGKEDFLIVGFSDLQELQVPLFCLFLVIYLMTMVGHLLVMTVIYSTAHLHTPMYFFLTNLSFLDLCYTTVFFLQMLIHFFRDGRYISFSECILHVYLFVFMVSTEFLLLGVMAFDRYVAICNPLRYMTIMNKGVCVQLAAGIWAAGLMDAIPHASLISGLPYCKSHTINHFFCDGRALMKLSCTSTLAIEKVTYIIGAIVGLVPCVLTIASYVNIVAAILKIQSSEGRWKAFSTCGSHLTVVVLFYGSVCATYMQPISLHTINDDKIMSLSYIIVTPLCNPIIYSLKNTEFKNAIRKASQRLKMTRTRTAAHFHI